MKKALVLGAGGFMAHHLQRRLKRRLLGQVCRLEVSSF